MSVRQANCPNCGGDLTFRAGTVVTVCKYCSSAVARTDRDLKLQGKVAALVDTASPLSVGADGRYQTSRFTLVGRTQLLHPAGGVWDEWYLALDDGRWGWLAEAQGRFYLTFQLEGAPRFTPEQVPVGSTLSLAGSESWFVHETGEAVVQSAEGELPFAFEPNAHYAYADLSGPNDSFATIDFGETPSRVFVGREIPLPELHIQGVEGFSTRPTISTGGLNCPNCAAPVALRLPDSSQRVTCDACNSMLDANHGHLAYLHALQPSKMHLVLDLGSQGNLDGVSYTLVGAMERYCLVEGDRYDWIEYLLYNVNVGFRWLMCSDGHWNFLEPASAAEIHEGHNFVSFEGEVYKKFQEVVAIVGEVRGEFYWRVEIGQRALAADFIAPPRLLSIDVADFQDTETLASSREVNWSSGRYVAPEEIAEAFGSTGRLTRPTGIAPSMPNPFQKQLEELKPYVVALVGILVAILTISVISTTRTTVLETDVDLVALGATGGNFTAVTQPFKIADARHPLEVSLRSRSDVNWVLLDGALVATDDRDQRVFNLAARNNLDTSDSTERILSGVRAGEYVVRLTGTYDGTKAAPTFALKVQTGVSRLIYPFLALLVILAWPAFQLIRRATFEGQRWHESNL